MEDVESIMDDNREDQVQHDRQARLRRRPPPIVPPAPKSQSSNYRNYASISTDDATIQQWADRYRAQIEKRNVQESAYDEAQKIETDTGHMDYDSPKHRDLWECFCEGDEELRKALREDLFKSEENEAKQASERKKEEEITEANTKTEDDQGSGKESAARSASAGRPPSAGSDPALWPNTGCGAKFMPWARGPSKVVEFFSDGKW